MSVRTLLGPCLAVATAGALALAPAAVAHDGPNRWTCLSHYESSHRWHINSGNGHYGGLQFSLSTWKYYGGPQWSENYWPHRATRREQIRIAKRVAWRGWRDRAPQGGRNAWPNTWWRCD